MIVDACVGEHLVSAMVGEFPNVLLNAKEVPRRATCCQRRRRVKDLPFWRDAQVPWRFLNVGDAFYVSTELKQEDGIVWDIVIVQKVNCPVGYYVDSANLICAEW